MAGIEEVARATGVSTATVSRALRGLPNVSDKTRAAVRRAADELGYVASSSASGLASGRTLAMGVVVPSVSRWFYTSVLEGVDAELRVGELRHDPVQPGRASRRPGAGLPPHASCASARTRCSRSASTSRRTSAISSPPSATRRSWSAAR